MDNEYADDGHLEQQDYYGDGQNQEYAEGYDPDANLPVDDVQQKQDYLRTEIIDMGYDATRFSEFLQIKKPGYGIDVNYYTFEELYEYVAEFQMEEYNRSLQNQDQQFGEADQVDIQHPVAQDAV